VRREKFGGIHARGFLG